METKTVSFGGSSFEVDERGYIVETLDAKKWAFRAIIDSRPHDKCWGDWGDRTKNNFMPDEMLAELKRLYPAAFEDGRFKWEGEENHSRFHVFTAIPQSPICSVTSKHTAMDHMKLVNAILKEGGFTFPNSGTDCEQFFMRVWFTKNKFDRTWKDKDGNVFDTWCFDADLLCGDLGLADKIQKTLAADSMYTCMFDKEDNPESTFHDEIEARLAKALERNVAKADVKVTFKMLDEQCVRCGRMIPSDESVKVTMTRNVDGKPFGGETEVTMCRECAAQAVKELKEQFSEAGEQDGREAQD